MNGIGGILQIMFFVVAILVVAKIMGFADNGTAVILAVAGGLLVYGLIYFISTRITAAKEKKQKAELLKRGKKPGKNKSK